MHVCLLYVCLYVYIETYVIQANNSNVNPLKIMK